MCSICSTSLLYYIEPFSSSTALQHVTQSQMNTDFRRTSLSQQLAPLQDEELYACDPMAALHFEMRQLLQNIRRAKWDIQDNYNHKRSLANLPPIDFAVTTNAITSTSITPHDKLPHFIRLGPPTH